MALAGQQSVAPKPQVVPPSAGELIQQAQDRSRSGGTFNFQAIIFGPFKAGKTRLLGTCKKPVWVDSFDPGGSQVLRDYVDRGEVIVDDRWAGGDFKKDGRFYEEYKRELETRIKSGLFKEIGTFSIDSVTTLSDSMFPWGEQQVLKQGKTTKAGMADPRSIYGECQTELFRLFRHVLAQPCDVVITAHPDNKEKEARVPISPQLIGRVKAPLALFNEIYYLEVVPQKGVDPIRSLLIDNDGEYECGSRLNNRRQLDKRQPPDITALKKLAGLI